MKCAEIFDRNFQENVTCLWNTLVLDMTQTLQTVQVESG